jgi:hypothetical protein
MVMKNHKKYQSSVVFGVTVAGSCVARFRDFCSFLVTNLNTFHILMKNRVCGVPRSYHLRVEPGVFVSGVVYSTGGAVGLHQLVVTFDFVAVTFLSLFLDVMSVCVLHTILEFIFGVGL